MAEFLLAVKLVLKNEGGFSDNPNDPGGATNFGISTRFLESLSEEKLNQYGFFNGVTISKIKAMTKEQAINIYLKEFWVKLPLEFINSQTVANYIFDMAVNHGIKQAIKIVQRSVWAVHAKRGIIEDDGIFGEKTIEAVNEFDDLLIDCMIATRAQFYRSLDERFLNGWLDRAYRLEG